MSILIKGMEMPTRCCECPMCHDYQFCRLAEKNFGEFDCIELRADWCPLIELPPHGRLIDADALPTYQKPIGKLMMYGGEYVYTQTAIDNAPTIIEAEGKDDKA